LIIDDRRLAILGAGRSSFVEREAYVVSPERWVVKIGRFNWRDGKRGTEYRPTGSGLTNKAKYISKKVEEKLAGREVLLNSRAGMCLCPLLEMATTAFVGAVTGVY
jgi:hypothetical protein